MTPTASDLRAAAELLQNVARNTNRKACYDDTWREIEAAQALARHYLASQPADGEEAITEETEPVEYVDALGLRSRWCIARWSDGRFVLVLDQSDSDEPLDLDKCDQVVFPVTTDHDVRRLCGVLGIPLREGKE